LIGEQLVLGSERQFAPIVERQAGEFARIKAMRGQDGSQELGEARVHCSTEYRVRSTE
jgi:hypothetical protein